MIKLRKMFLVITLISALGGCMGYNSSKDWQTRLENIDEKVVSDQDKLVLVISATNISEFRRPALKFLKKKLKEGVSPNSRIYNGQYSLLYQAIIVGSLDAVKILLEYGADINMPVKGGIRPLDIASAMAIKNSFATEKEYMQIRDYLVSKGAYGSTNELKS